MGGLDGIGGTGGTVGTGGTGTGTGGTATDAGTGTGGTVAGTDTGTVGGLEGLGTPSDTAGQVISTTQTPGTTVTTDAGTVTTDAGTTNTQNNQNNQTTTTTDGTTTTTTPTTSNTNNTPQALSPIEQLYMNLLNRMPEEGAASYWQSRIDAVGMEAAQREFDQGVAAERGQQQQAPSPIEQLYATLLNRAPDEGALDYWQSRIDAVGMEAARQEFEQGVAAERGASGATDQNTTTTGTATGTATDTAGTPAADVGATAGGTGGTGGGALADIGIGNVGTGSAFGTDTGTGLGTGGGRGIGQGEGRAGNAEETGNRPGTGQTFSFNPDPNAPQTAMSPADIASARDMAAGSQLASLQSAYNAAVALNDPRADTLGAMLTDALAEHQAARGAFNSMMGTEFGVGVLSTPPARGSALNDAFFTGALNAALAQAARAQADLKSLQDLARSQTTSPLSNVTEVADEAPDAEAFSDEDYENLDAAKDIVSETLGPMSDEETAYSQMGALSNLANLATEGRPFGSAPYGRAGQTVGSIASALTGVPGLGMGLGALGTRSDVNALNAELAAMGFPADIGLPSSIMGNLSYGLIGTPAQAQFNEIIDTILNREEAARFGVPVTEEVVAEAGPAAAAPSGFTAAEVNAMEQGLATTQPGQTGSYGYGASPTAGGSGNFGAAAAAERGEAIGPPGEYGGLAGLGGDVGDKGIGDTSADTGPTSGDKGGPGEGGNKGDSPGDAPGDAPGEASTGGGDMGGGPSGDSGDGYKEGGLVQFAEGGLVPLAGGGKIAVGPGGGLDDLIPTSINGRRAAALSDGEFVIPADVVSMLGDGSSNAGSRRLYDLMRQIRDAKTGTTRQAGPLPVGEILKRSLGR